MARRFQVVLAICAVVAAIIIGLGVYGFYGQVHDLGDRATESECQNIQDHQVNAAMLAAEADIVRYLMGDPSVSPEMLRHRQVGLDRLAESIRGQC
jgi:uncharacterized protein HemX